MNLSGKYSQQNSKCSLPTLLISINRMLYKVMIKLTIPRPNSSGAETWNAFISLATKIFSTSEVMNFHFSIFSQAYKHRAIIIISIPSCLGRKPIASTFWQYPRHSSRPHNFEYTITGDFSCVLFLWHTTVMQDNIPFSCQVFDIQLCTCWKLETEICVNQERK